MPKFFTFILLLFLWSCTHDTSTNIHSTSKDLYTLSSSEGQELFQRSDSTHYKKTKLFWQPQRRNYCGVCSLTIAGNTLSNKNNLNQDNFFDNQVAEEVITPANVSRMGMTLRELNEACQRLLPQINAQAFYAHNAGLDLFRQQIRSLNPKTQIIVNFSRQSLNGDGMRSGHFSLITSYDPETKRVLILEVQGSRESFWVQDKDLYYAMLAEDPVSKISRGWLRLIKE
jgi:hypothetical protein